MEGKAEGLEAADAADYATLRVVQLRQAGMKHSRMIFRMLT